MYPFSPKLPSHPGCHITLSRVPLAIQWIVPPHLKQAETSPPPDTHTLFCSKTFSVIQDWWSSHSVVSESYDPMDCSLPGSSVHGISQARILGWVAISFSKGSSLPRDLIRVSCIGSRFFTTEPPGKQSHKSLLFLNTFFFFYINFNYFLSYIT